MADDDGKFLLHDSPITMRTEAVPWNIVFNNEVGDEVGRLGYDSQGQLEFKGETDRSAEIFFTAVIRSNNQEMEDMRELAKQGWEVVNDFLPNVSKCALQDYGRLNDFMIKAGAEFDETDGSEETEGS